MIDVSATNAFIIWKGIYHENGNMCIRQKIKFLISLEIQGVHKVFRQFKKFIDITTDVGNV